MFAHVLPLRRLPRRAPAFIYHVPDDLIGRIRIGQLVTIPFLSSTLFGIVESLSDTASSFFHSNGRPVASFKTIRSIEREEPILSSTHLSLARDVAGMYGMPCASAIHLFVPRLSKRVASGLELIPLPPISRTLSFERPQYALYQNHDEHQAALREAVRGATLVLIPEISQAKDVWELLSPRMQKHTIVWHSQHTKKEQFNLWRAVRNKEKTIVIGTRGAVFLPFPSLETIIIEREHDENHKHWDQTPRFHVKDMARFLQDAYGASLTLMSFSMSAESYYAVHKGYYKEIRNHTCEIRNKKEAAHIIDMRDERRGKNYGLFSHPVANAILSATGAICLFINRRGYASSVGCRDCGLVMRCKTCTLPMVYHEQERGLQCHHCKTNAPMTVQCPSCGSTLVALHGAGVELAEKEVRRLLGAKANRAIVRIEADEDAPITEKDPRAVYIGTSRLFSVVPWQKVSVFVFLDVDRQLAIPEYCAGEDVVHRIKETEYCRMPGSELFIQTSHPRHLALRAITEPDRWYRTELNLRRSLGYPPYRYIVRYLYAHANERHAAGEADALYHRLASALTDGEKQDIVEAPIPLQPFYYRKKYWYAIIAKLMPYGAREKIEQLNALVPDGWRIDPNPTTLLSP